MRTGYVVLRGLRRRFGVTRKPRGKRPGERPSEVTRFKEMWRELLSRREQKAWLALFNSATSCSAIREKMAEQLEVRLAHDRQVSDIRQWVIREAEEEKHGRAARRKARSIRKRHPRWSKEKVREEMLKWSYDRAQEKEDEILGLRTVSADVQVERLGLAWEKFQESQRTKLERGLDALAAAFKENPEALKLYQQARDLIAPKK